MDNVMEGQIMESRQDAAVTDEMENLRKNIKKRMAESTRSGQRSRKMMKRKKNLHFFSGNREPHPMRDMSNCRPILQ